MNGTIKKNNPPVRLNKEEIENLQASVSFIDPHATIYLFGSRTDLTKKGGDIDLLIISQTMKRSDVSHIRWNFFDAFGEQKMDIVIDNGSAQSPFVQMIFPKAVEL